MVSFTANIVICFMVDNTPTSKIGYNGRLEQTTGTRNTNIFEVNIKSRKKCRRTNMISSAGEKCAYMLFAHKREIGLVKVPNRKQTADKGAQYSNLSNHSPHAPLCRDYPSMGCASP